MVPPQLAVEVRSESTWRFDVGPKKRVYEEAGLGEQWLVDTAGTAGTAPRPCARRGDCSHGGNGQETPR